jgi:hypothetical protein
MPAASSDAAMPSRALLFPLLRDKLLRRLLLLREGLRRLLGIRLCTYAEEQLTIEERPATLQYNTTTRSLHPFVDMRA